MSSSRPDRRSRFSNMRKPLKYDNEIRTQFRKFIYKISTKLVDIVENRYHSYNSSPEIDKIVQAVITLMFIYRVRYRNVYHSVHKSIIHRKNFLEFCKKFYEQDKLPYFFAFLLNIAMKFEMFLYLREEGHNHFGAFAFSVGEDSRYFYFEAKGGAQRLAETAEFFLERVKDLQMLVKLEDPLSEELLSLDDQLDYVNINDLETSEYDSLILLQDIDRSFYSGLQRYLDCKVLPYIILRFILRGRVPDSIDARHKKKISIDKYYSRCLIPEVITGAAFEDINRAEKLINNMNEIFKNEVANANKASKKGKKKNRKKKSKELNIESLCEEADLSSEDKNYGNGLEWLRGFDAKTLSLLNNDCPKNFTDILQSVEDSSLRKDFDPLSEAATGTVSSVKYNLGAKRKESSLNYANTEENDCSSRKEFDPLGQTGIGTASSVKHNIGMKRREEENCSSRREHHQPLSIKAIETVLSVKYNLGTRRKEKFSRDEPHGVNRRRADKDKLLKDDSDSDDDSFSVFDERNPLLKLTDNLIHVINGANPLHGWEKKILFRLINEAKVFSSPEIITLCEKIIDIPDKDYLIPGEEEDLKHFFEIIRMEDRVDSLYSEDAENEHILGKIPCPEHKEIITDSFVEIMICILALSCDKLIHVDVLGSWIPMLQNVLLENRRLTKLFIRYGLNCLLPFLSSHAHLLLNP